LFEVVALAICALAINALAINALAICALAINALAINALAINALAINALAINALAINALAIAIGIRLGHAPSASRVVCFAPAPAGVCGAPARTGSRRIRARPPRRQRARPQRAYQALTASSRTCAARTPFTAFQHRMVLPSIGCACERSRSQLAAYI
jgi:hypothetical protein